MPSTSTKPRPARARRDGGSGQERHRTCCFCDQNIEVVEFTDVAALRRVTSDKGKIRSRRVTGVCRRHQNQVGVAVKRAREMALLPLVNS
jgi:small subunit ribosomal protein S18